MLWNRLFSCGLLAAALAGCHKAPAEPVAPAAPAAPGSSEFPVTWTDRPEREGR